jgi:hypothetical protein
VSWIGLEWNCPSTAVSPCLLLYLTLTYRLIKLRNLNLIRTAFVGFLFIHIKATKLKLFCADLWGKQDGRLLETVLSVWRSYAASRKLRHTSQTWALVRHHVRRNVHRAFVRLLANRAIRIKKVRMDESS